ncbi:MAG: hypothetical protein XD60_0945 [Acetothermia bacterium 64_32]|nr:MAG: hypothetical protein XD60_0945 [Acetothermia bacterium 64_32]
MNKRLLGLTLMLVLAGGVSFACGNPIVIPGNPDCDDLCYRCYEEFKLDPPEKGTFSDPDGPLTVTIYNAVYKPKGEMLSFSWSSNIPVSAVIVKGGPWANVYYYCPPATGDSWLHAPGWKGINHITFCYIPPQLEVEVSGLSDFTVTQEFIGQGNRYAPLGTLSVTITASTGYTASVYYTYEVLWGSTSPFTGDPLSLQADSGTWYIIPQYPSYITLPDFSGGPGTETHTYPVRVDLSLLGDRDAGDVIRFTVHVTVSDPWP